MRVLRLFILNSVVTFDAVKLLSQYFPHVFPATAKAFVRSGKDIFYSLLTQVRVLCYHYRVKTVSISRQTLHF